MHSTWSHRKWSYRATAVTASIVLTLVVLGAALMVPLRAQGGDTVPGRLAMVTLACDGRSDLESIDWLRVRTIRGRLPYFARITDDGRSIVSSFGPGPGWLGRAFFTDVPHGSVIDDSLIQTRARWAASAALALSALLLAVGLLATSDLVWAIAAAGTASLSFAGTASLGQGLWQQTAALPWYMLAMAASLWCRRYPRLIAVAVVSAVVGCWLRPPDAPLGLSLVGLAIARTELRNLNVPRIAVTLVGVVVVSIVMGSWNLWYYGTFLPTAQWQANQRAALHVLTLNPRHLFVALVGLIVSPGRGLLWFAPFIPVAAWIALRRRGPVCVQQTTLLAGLAAELVICAAFYKWWGGIAYGPRLLALATWVLIAVPFLDGVPKARWHRMTLAVAMAQTILVGLAGLWFYDPRKWEIPNNPDRHSERLFSIGHSHWSKLLQPPPDIGRVVDAPEGPFRYCDPKGLAAK